MWYFTNRFDGDSIVCAQGQSAKDVMDRMGSYDSQSKIVNGFLPGQRELVVNGPHETLKAARLAGIQHYGSKATKEYKFWYMFSTPIKPAQDEFVIVRTQSREEAATKLAALGICKEADSDDCRMRGPFWTEGDAVESAHAEIYGKDRITPKGNKVSGRASVECTAS